MLISLHNVNLVTVPCFMVQLLIFIKPQYMYIEETNWYGTYIVWVTKLDSLQHLPHDLLHVAFIRSSWVSLKVIECGVVHKLKHKVEALLASKHFNQIHQVFMAKLLWFKWPEISVLALYMANTGKGICIYRPEQVLSTVKVLCVCTIWSPVLVCCGDTWSLILA